MTDPNQPANEPKLAKNETIKADSNYLRGTIADGLLDDSTGALAADDTQLTKFHGIYQQDDRDLRGERRKAKQERAYAFMTRVRVPGGVCTPQQWLAMDRFCTDYANGTLKLTTRQAFQLHGIIKKNLKTTIREINDSLMDTIAACGDVNRNVMCNPNPYQSRVHAEAMETARAISAHLTPATRAYHEIWLVDENGEKENVTPAPEPEAEPIYGKTYLPRKFKIGIAVPPSNDVDVFANDLGFIAAIEGDRIVGYTVTVGGGMGMSHGKEESYPRLADVLGFCTPEQVTDVAEKIVTTQRDFGDRADRRHARLKYTIEDLGLDWFRGEVESRLGYALGQAGPFEFDHNGDRYGWVDDENGNSHLTLFIQNGCVVDTDDFPMRTGLREIAKVHDGDFRLTANQNLIIANVSPAKRPGIEALLGQYKLADSHDQTGLRLNSMACVALPTCGLALAEAQRYLPDLLTELDGVLGELGLRDDAITVRMTGCPNGCARPYISEIAFVGRSPGKYNIYLGGGFTGDRLNKLYKNSAKQEEIIGILRPILERYASERNDGERFGDFVIRAGYVAETREGREFHDDFKEE
ncbi:MAG: NADPH-dependent assimilatory sulfite reductase hemoprotein subunit [Verrucomicrobiota bacterium]|jgi:sulfite reductase (NADPH) hemoprotein beta-component|nr:NADPH-dependent assimilatory sulfite reductase hemoprotein subunit [Verrucomicrobiota bacterium]MDP6754418.1 NADPH-dependent assimilatory sulfite reductase hemoprotein subunit [Verrucomicrobiota bacterium]